MADEYYANILQRDNFHRKIGQTAYIYLRLDARYQSSKGNFKLARAKGEYVRQSRRITQCHHTSYMLSVHVYLHLYECTNTQNIKSPRSFLYIVVYESQIYRKKIASTRKITCCLVFSFISFMLLFAIYASKNAQAKDTLLNIKILLYDKIQTTLRNKCGNKCGLLYINE